MQITIDVPLTVVDTIIELHLKALNGKADEYVAQCFVSDWLESQIDTAFQIVNAITEGEII